MAGIQTREWWEAHYDPQQGWNITKKEWQPQHVDSDNYDDSPPITQTPLKNYQGLTFSKVIEKLTKYEAEQQDRGYIPFDSGEPYDLGEKHFIAFAEREGIVFDIDGTPHRTINGHIPGKGVFPADASEKAEEAYRDKANRLKTPLTDLLPEGNTQNFLIKRDAIEQIDLVVTLLKQVENYMNRMLPETALTIHHARKGQKGETLDIKNGYKQEYEAIRILLSSTDSLYTGQEAVDLVINVPLKVFQYILYQGVAAFTQAHVKKSCHHKTGTKYCTPDIANSFRESAKNILEEMGYKKDVEESVYRTFRIYGDYFEDDEGEKVFEGLETVIEHLEETKDFFEHELDIGNGQYVDELPAQEDLLEVLKPPSP